MEQVAGEVHVDKSEEKKPTDKKRILTVGTSNEKKPDGKSRKERRKTK